MNQKPVDKNNPKRHTMVMPPTITQRKAGRPPISGIPQKAEKLQVSVTLQEREAIRKGMAKYGLPSESAVARFLLVNQLRADGLIRD